MNAEIATELERAKKDPAPDAVSSLLGSYSEVERAMAEALDELDTDALLRTAIKFQIPYPLPPGRGESSPYWYRPESHIGKRRSVFNREGMAHVRAQIRAERKAKVEAWTMYVPIISALTGLGGIAIALVTVLKSAG